MMTVNRMLMEWAKGAFEQALQGTGADLSKMSVAATANPEFGDYQCNDAMALAKALKKNPREIARKVAEGAELHESIDKIEVAGAGFINIHLKPAWIADYVQRMTAAPQLGIPQDGQGRTVVMDYSSPNVAKPMHIGHIRSTIIGNSLDRIFRRLGYRVISDNHIGDWGTQFGIIIMGYRHFLDKEAFARSPVEELERIYVKSYNKTKEDKEWMDKCRMELVKLQSGDPDNLNLWKQFVEVSMKEFDRVYRRLGVSFDLTRGESHYNSLLKSTIELLEKKGLAVESEGATVVFLEDEKLPVCIVRKSDGGFNYAATDLATVATRIGEFGPEKIVYVTDERQQLHFRQVFAICRRLGYETKLEHVWFGLMRLPEGTFSTREGNVIKLERLLDEAESRALEIVKQASPGMSAEQHKEVARAVGIGAVKYADLSQNPQTTVTFTWEKAMALDGNSGPYLQYTYARISSVVDKYAERYPGGRLEDHPIDISEPASRALVLRLVRFPEAVIRAAEGYKPSVIADYLYDTAQAYNAFYQNVPFLKAPDGVRESRIRLCKAVATVLKQGLDLLGIETPERI
jgi:arginyl-tRNA synthetase